MAEQDWNNNSDALDAMLQDIGVVPPLPVDESPISTGPFVVRDLEARLVALELRVTAIEETRE